MSLPSTMSNVIIEGNTIGASSSFTYDYLLITSADCTITSNNFSGITPGGTHSMIWLSNSTNNIHGNTFIRGASSVTSYIQATGSVDQIITNNIFDAMTTDGSNENLATGLTVTSIFEKNKNQIKYAVIPMSTEEASIYGTTYASTAHAIIKMTPDFTYAVRAGAVQDNNIAEIWDQQTNTPTSRYFGKSLDLNGRIPQGARILDVKTSIYNESTVPLDTTGGINTFTIAMQTSNNHLLAIDSKTYPSDTVSNWMLNYGAKYTLTINAGNEANLRSAYQVLELNASNFTTDSSHSLISGATVTNQDISSNFITGADDSLTVSFKFNFLRTASVFDLIIVMSPLIVKYAW